MTQKNPSVKILDIIKIAMHTTRKILSHFSLSFPLSLSQNFLSTFLFERNMCSGIRQNTIAFIFLPSVLLRHFISVARKNKWRGWNNYNDRKLLCNQKNKKIKWDFSWKKERKINICISIKVKVAVRIFVSLEIEKLFNGQLCIHVDIFSAWIKLLCCFTITNWYIWNKQGV